MARVMLPDGSAIGLVRGSYDRALHLVRYVPYRSGLPREPLCGRYVGTMTGGHGTEVCERCRAIAYRTRELAHRLPSFGSFNA